MKRLIVLVGVICLLIFSTNAFALTVSVANVQGTPGQGNIAVPIRLSNVTAADIMNMELFLNYDKSRVEVTGVSAGGLTGAWTRYSNPDNGAGLVKICLTNLDPLASQEGTAVNVIFSVKSSAPAGQSNLTLTKAIFKLTSADVINNGKFIVIGSGPSMEPIPASTVKVGELLFFNIVASGEGLVYSATGVPSGAVFNSVAHTFSWVPTSGQEGAYNVVFTVTDNQGRKASQTASITVKPATPGYGYTFSWEAETGTLVSPMKIKETSSASGGKCVYSPENNKGKVSYTFNVPATGDYRIWCRVKSNVSKYHIVFYAYIDGGKQKYLKNKHEDSWEWLILKTAPHGSAYHYKVQLTAGTHTIVFKCKKGNTYLDKLIITNNMDLEP